MFSEAGLGKGTGEGENGSAIDAAEDADDAGVFLVTGNGEVRNPVRAYIAYGGDGVADVNGGIVVLDAIKDRLAHDMGEREDPDKDLDELNP